MPYDYSTITLPGGAQAIKLVGAGVIGKEDAEVLMHRIDPGGPYHGMPMLVHAQEIDRFSPEARNIFSTAPPGVVRPWCAVVVTSAIVRTTVNFLLRVSRTNRTRMFSTEPPAIAWLDERAREDAAKQQPPAAP